MGDGDLGQGGSVSLSELIARGSSWGLLRRQHLVCGGARPIPWGERENLRSVAVPDQANWQGTTEKMSGFSRAGFPPVVQFRGFRLVIVRDCGLDGMLDAVLGASWTASAKKSPFNNDSFSRSAKKLLRAQLVFALHVLTSDNMRDSRRALLIVIASIVGACRVIV